MRVSRETWSRGWGGEVVVYWLCKREKRTGNVWAMGNVWRYILRRSSKGRLVKGWKVVAIIIGDVILRMLVLLFSDQGLLLVVVVVETW